MADLGFDFSDDQDDYQEYDEGNLSSSTSGLNDKSDLSTITTAAEVTAATATSTNTTTAVASEGVEQQEYHLNGADNSFAHTLENNDTAGEYDKDTPELFISSNRLLEAPEEGYTSESLLQAILTEESNEGELDDNALVDMDENLTSAERVYKFSKSNVMFYRHLVAKELPNALYDVDVNEAITELLPLVLKLAYDEDEAVRETFVSELDKIIIYFYQNAPPVMEKERPSKSTSFRSALSNPSSTTTTSESSTSTQKQQQQKEESRVNETVVAIAKDESKDDNNQHETKHVEETRPQPYSATFSADKQTENKLLDEKETTDDQQTSFHYEHHIPPKKFASLLIALLLDQNSNLASLGQQCIVSVAAELASSSPESGRAELDRYLLDTEIFDGVVMGLMEIIDGKFSDADQELDTKNGDSKHDTEEEGLSANLSAASLDKESTTSVMRRPSATPGFEPSSISQSTDDSRQGEINLAKMMCLSLISALTVVLGSEWATGFCLPIVENLAPDPMFYVRKEAAGAICSLATVVDADVAYNRLLPLYLNFSRDTIWHVRRSCVLTLPLLCSVLPEETKVQIATEGVEIFKNDVSRNVRNTLAEVIGELIAKFLPEDWETTGRPGKVPGQLLSFFLSLGASGNTNQMFKLETDRAIICAYNFPAVVLTVGADYWDSHLKDTYLSLTKDYQIKVRRTFAYSLHEIARIIGPDRTERDLVQIFALYLMDLDDVKQGVLEHLAEFLGTLAVSSRNEYIPILTEVWDGVMTNWRLRDILAAQLREIALLFDAARVVEHVLPLAIRACNDEFAAVRETGVEAFPVILEIVKRAVDEEGENLSHGDAEEEEDTKENKRNFALALLNHVMERLDEFVRSDMYRGRLVFTQICRSLLEAGISAGDFASFFLSRLVPLAVDPIVNVRIGAARTIRQVFLNEGYRQELANLTPGEDLENQEVLISQSVSTLLEQMVYRLALDKDPDVRMFVFDLVDSDLLQEKEKLLGQQQEGSTQQIDTDEGVMVGTPMQDIEGSSSPTTTSLAEAISSSTNADSSSSVGHNLMRRILSDNEDDDDGEENYIAEPSVSPRQQHAVEHVPQQHTRSTGRTGGIFIDDDATVDDKHLNGDITEEQQQGDQRHDQHQLQLQHQHQNNGDQHSIQGTGDQVDVTQDLYDNAAGTPMDCSDEDDIDNSKRDNHDEDGDEMMTEAERDDSEEEPAMIDEDDETESTFAEKEKGEYVYLSKSPHESVVTNSPTLNVGKDAV